MVVTALMMGLAGSFHCAGMCSPLVIAITNNSRQAMFSRLVYNGGRIFTYSILGGIISSVGLVVPLFRFQSLLSVIFGVVLIVAGAFGLSKFRFTVVSGVMAKLAGLVKDSFSDFLKKKNGGATFMLGMLNGMLPCGLSLIALTFCLALAGPIDGFQFMLFFGIGTLPVMVGFAGVIQWLAMRIQINIRRLSTLFLILSGVLLITRVFLIHAVDAGTLTHQIQEIVMCR
jgi:sulfite exporter TauE/SafE